MTRIAEYHREKLWCLRSGGAGGADTAFYNGGKDRCQIFLPFDGFNGFSVDNKTFFTYTSDAMKVAKLYHPAWERCGSAAKKFHARNIHQVLGPHLNEPVEAVICWTPDGEASGGTGQALRVAQDKDRFASLQRRAPFIFNLQRPLETLPQYIRELK